MYDNGVVVEIVSLAKDGRGPTPTTRAAVPMVVAIFCKCSRRDDDDDDDEEDDETWLLNAVQVVVTVASTRAMVIDFMFDNELSDEGREVFFSPGSRFGHNVRRPTQFVCPNNDTICPSNDKIYLTIVTSKFLLLFFAYILMRSATHFSLPVRGLPSFGFPPRR